MRSAVRRPGAAKTSFVNLQEPNGPKGPREVAPGSLPQFGHACSLWKMVPPHVVGDRCVPSANRNGLLESQRFELQRANVPTR